MVLAQAYTAWADRIRTRALLALLPPPHRLGGLEPLGRARPTYLTFLAMSVTRGTR